MGSVKKRIKEKVLELIPGRDPDFIVAGAQKSGTTSLYRYLAQHPDIVGSDPVEVHYFDRYMNYGYDFDWYRTHFKSTKFFRPGLAYFEATPSYLYYEKVAEKMKEHYPDLKLIFILRDPVERAFSAWNMYRDFFDKGEFYRFRDERAPSHESKIYKYLMKDRESFPEIEECIEIEQRLMETDPGEDEPSILRRGLYAKQFKAYLNYFENEQIRVFGFREFVDHIHATVDTILDFVGVDKTKWSGPNVKVYNARSYDTELSYETRAFLEEFYSGQKKELEHLIGKKIDW